MTLGLWRGIACGVGPPASSEDSCEPNEPYRDEAGNPGETELTAAETRRNQLALAGAWGGSWGREAALGNR